MSASVEAATRPELLLRPRGRLRGVTARYSPFDGGLRTRRPRTLALVQPPRGWCYASVPRRLQVGSSNGDGQPRRSREHRPRDLAQLGIFRPDLKAYDLLIQVLGEAKCLVQDEEISHLEVLIRYGGAKVGQHTRTGQHSLQ